MIKNPAHAKTLFVIAENFLDSVSDESTPGAGTACLREYTLKHFRGKNEKYPRAVGIPTGWAVAAGGFPILDNDIKTAIDTALDRAALILDQLPNLYDRVIYSCSDDDDNIIGAGVFRNTLSDDVVKYISDGIHGLPTREVPTGMKFSALRKRELLLLRHALMVEWCAMEHRRRQPKREAQGGALSSAAPKRMMPSRAGAGQQSLLRFTTG